MAVRMQWHRRFHASGSCRPKCARLSPRATARGLSRNTLSPPPKQARARKRSRPGRTWTHPQGSARSLPGGSPSARHEFSSTPFPPVGREPARSGPVPQRSAAQCADGLEFSMALPPLYIAPPRSHPLPRLKPKSAAQRSLRRWSPMDRSLSDRRNVVMRSSCHAVPCRARAMPCRAGPGPCRAQPGRAGPGRRRRCIDCLCAAHCTARASRLLRMLRLTCAVIRARKRMSHSRGRSTPERSLLLCGRSAVPTTVTNVA